MSDLCVQCVHTPATEGNILAFYSLFPTYSLWHTYIHISQYFPSLLFLLSFKADFNLVFSLSKVRALTTVEIWPKGFLL